MSYEDLKIGKLVQTVLKPLIISKATKQEISKMQELEYSKATFGIQYPLLLKTTSSVTEKHYYSELFTIYGETYRLCCEWYETASNNDRPYVEKWIKEHETMVTEASADFFEDFEEDDYEVEDNYEEDIEETYGTNDKIKNSILKIIFNICKGIFKTIFYLCRKIILLLLNIIRKVLVVILKSFVNSAKQVKH